MTSFDDFEKSRESSRPIELFELTIGGSTFRYATGEDIITIGTSVFDPIPISRSDISQGSDAANRTINVTLPANNPFAMFYVSTVPGERAFVSIFRYQRDEVPAFATTVLLFSGLVQSVSFPNDAQSAEISVRSLENALNENVPKFTFMGMCNHFLYDANCAVDPSAHNHIGLVTAASGNDITVAGAGASGFDFVAGFCRPVGEFDFRTVYAQSGDVLTLLLPFSTDPLGSSVQIFAGCDHLVLGDCALTYDNVDRFGGFAFVPNRNIFETGLDPA